MKNKIDQTEIQHVSGKIRLEIFPSKCKETIFLLPDNRIRIGKGSIYRCFKNISDKYDFIESCKKQGIPVDDSEL